MRKIFPTYHLPQKTTALIFILISFLTPGCSFVAELRTPYPPDAEMEKHFNDNRETFEEIVQMFQENAELWQLDADGKAWVDFEKPASLPQLRSDKYRELMKRTEILTMYRHHPSEGQPPSPAIYMKVWQVPNMIIVTKSNSTFLNLVEEQI